MIFSSRVPPPYNGLTLVNYLASRFTYRTAVQWRQCVDTGKIRVNGQEVDSGYIVRPDETVSYIAPDIDEPEANTDYHIIYEDEWLLGIDKPPNLLVHKGGRAVTNNLIYFLRYLEGYRNANIINRLDRETSGVVLAAKTKPVVRKMNKLLQNKKLEKEYIALVHGIFDPSIREIDLPIGKDRTQTRISKFVADPAKGKPSLSTIEEVEHIGDHFSLIRIHPATGRTHQLRVHLHEAGHTVVGDKLYGLPLKKYFKWLDNPDSFKDSFLLDRHALHCRSVSFTHPISQTQETITAQIPSDMQALITSLRSGTT
jgi:RluA family pseudouridine synthase